MNKGFALPTVMIASIVMLIVLLSGLVSASSVNSALRSQYQDKVLKEAAEAGVAMVNACLAQSYNQVTWTGKTLKPNTNCNGDTITGTNAPSLYLVDTPTLKTTFEVPPLAVEDNGQRANVKGILVLTRSSGAERERREDTSSALIGNQNSFSNVAFGYYNLSDAADGGVQLAVILSTGEVKTLGRNTNGRLGNGNTSDYRVPQTFILPVGERGIAAFSNFLSIGRQFSVVTASGKVFSSGTNDFGQLGNTASGTATPRSTPVQFNLPAGNARFAAMSNYATYVMTDQNRVYAAGYCGPYGLLGNNNTSCGSQATPVLVQLPTPVDANTQPALSSTSTQADNIAVDRFNVYVRMVGGAVYGWGINDGGQLGVGDLATKPIPVRIGAFGNAGQPQIKKLGFDGETLFMLDNQNALWTAGKNTFGIMAGAAGEIRHSTGLCLDNYTGSTSPGNRQAVYTCNRGAAQKYQWHSDGTIRVQGGNCLDNLGGVNANGNPIGIWPCNGSIMQQWVMDNNGSIRNPNYNRCIDNPNNSTTPGTYLQLFDCNGSPAQQWSLTGTWTPEQVQLPASANGVTRFSTDQWSLILVDGNGEAWGAGANEMGQLGNGTTRYYSPAPTKVVGLPAGKKVVDVYTSKYEGLNAGTANTYFILEDGTVWGTGANSYGQLGYGSTSGFRTTPIQMNLPTGTIAKSVQTAGGTTVVLTTNGTVFTVGNNSHGQLGDGTTTNSSTPKANEYTNQRTTVSY